MNKDELLKQVDDIYCIISAFSVSGDAVDVVAQMRAMLRNLRTGIAKLPEMGAKEAVDNGDRTTGTLPAVKISDLPPTPDIYDSKRVPTGLKSPKGEPGVKEVNDNG